MNTLIQQYINKQKDIKAVKVYDLQNNKIEYSKEIKGWKISKLRDDNKPKEEISEEMVRAYILTKLVNELGYDLKKIEIEKKYSIGRKPKGEKGARIDVIVRDSYGNAFLYIELKTPREYDKNQDEILKTNFSNLPLRR